MNSCHTLSLKKRIVIATTICGNMISPTDTSVFRLICKRNKTLQTDHSKRNKTFQVFPFIYPHITDSNFHSFLSPNLPLLSFMFFNREGIWPRLSPDKEVRPNPFMLAWMTFQQCRSAIPQRFGKPIPSIHHTVQYPYTNSLV